MLGSRARAGELVRGTGSRCGSRIGRDGCALFGRRGTRRRSSLLRQEADRLRTRRTRPCSTSTRSRPSSDGRSSAWPPSSRGRRPSSAGRRPLGSSSTSHGERSPRRRAPGDAPEGALHRGRDRSARRSPRRPVLRGGDLDPRGLRQRRAPGHGRSSPRCARPESRFASLCAELGRAARGAVARDAGESRSGLAACGRARSASYLASLREEQALNRQQIAELTDQAAQAESRSQDVGSSGGEAEAAASRPALAPPTSGAKMTVSSTGYCLRGTTATGIPVAWGVIATDPTVIPLGTRMFVPGYGRGCRRGHGLGGQGRDDRPVVPHLRSGDRVGPAHRHDHPAVRLRLQSSASLLARGGGQAWVGRQ